MAKKVVEEVVEEVVAVEETIEVSTVVLNEAVPEREDPGHNSRDFNK